MKRRGRAYLLTGVVALLVLAGAVGISTSTVTRHGVNFQVSTREIRPHVKVLDFLHRHYQYQMYANEITRGLGSDLERVFAVFDWTRQNIRKTPDGWPVVDDHVLNIMIRGHGYGDQMADVFTTLSTYAGVPAFWRARTAPGTEKQLVLSFTRLEGEWVVFDVKNGLTFRNERGAFASAEEIAANPGLVGRTAGPLLYHGIPYDRYFDGFAPPTAPRTLRAELQMPWPRLIFETTRLFGDSQEIQPLHSRSADAQDR